MISNKKTIRVLNNLIQINNDRIRGYEKAIDEAGDLDLDIRSIFTRMIQESRQNILELANEVTAMGGESVEKGIIGFGAQAFWFVVGWVVVLLMWRSALKRYSAVGA